MTNPPKRITDLVDARDGFACVRCGRSLTVSSGSRHHRMRRRDGGHSAAQLVLLCGSGTTGCHGWAHANPAKAWAVGLIVPAVRRPALVPAEVPVRTWQGWVLLDEAGLSVPVGEGLALELLEVFGMLPRLEVGA